MARQEKERPEIVIGIAAAVGTPLRFFLSNLTEALSAHQYSCEELHLSLYTKSFKLNGPSQSEPGDEFERIRISMDRGDELRSKTRRADVLALCAIADIHNHRPAGTKSMLAGYAFVLRQLKRPEEVYKLRQVYGSGFHLVGLYCPRGEREKYLRRSHGIPKSKVEQLFERDEHEPLESGQKLRDTFHLADVFLDISQDEIWCRWKTIYGSECRILPRWNVRRKPPMTWRASQ